MAKRRRKIKNRKALFDLLSVLMGLIFFIGLAVVIMLMSSEPSISDAALSAPFEEQVNPIVETLLHQTETQNTIHLTETQVALTAERNQTSVATVQP